MEKAQQLIDHLKTQPGILGISVHGGLSTTPRHETDFSSDLDITILVARNDDGTLPNWLPNFKFYVPFNGQMNYLEIDCYQFIDDELEKKTQWNAATREGYAYSTDIVYDPTGKFKEIIDRKSTLTPEYRAKKISQLANKIEKLFTLCEKTSNSYDTHIIINKIYALATETLFYLNWEYVPDLKWKTSIMYSLENLPKFFGEIISDTMQVKNPTISAGRLPLITRLWLEIRRLLEEDGIFIYPSQENDNTSFDNELSLKRAYTRLDKYSWYSPIKCVKRALPTNGHDIINKGIEYFIETLYLINDVKLPSISKRVEKLDSLSICPRNIMSDIYKVLSVYDYTSGEDVIRRSEILEKLFEFVKNYIKDNNLFTTCSLYSGKKTGEDLYIEEDIFGENSPYMSVFKKMYKNRQLKEETFAEKICKEYKEKLTLFEKNMLFGLCNEYLISTKEELLSLPKNELHPKYQDVLNKIC